MEWQSVHRTDDAFTSYPYWAAVKRRGGIAPLMASLGATGWLLWPHLERGGTLLELVEATGLSISAVKHSIRKYMSLGLVAEETINRDGTYQLIEQAEERLDTVRPHLVTCGVGQMRAGRNHLDSANYAAFRLRRRRHMEPKDVLWWEELRNRNDRMAAIYFDLLDSQGFDARMKVGKEKQVRRGRSIRIDYGEEWRSWGRSLYDNYRALGDIDYDEKVRLLTISRVAIGVDNETYLRAHREMRERVDLMLMMANRVGRYERKEAEDYYEGPAPKPVHEQLAFALAEVPHG